MPPEDKTMFMADLIERQVEALYELLNTTREHQICALECVLRRVKERDQKETARYTKLFESVEAMQTMYAPGTK